MYGAFGSPITPLAEWFSSTMMNARSSRTWSPPDPWLATGVAPLGSDSPTVSAAATPATAPTARIFARLVLKTMLTLQLQRADSASPAIHLSYSFAQVRRKMTELNGLSSLPGKPAPCGELPAGPWEGAWTRVEVLLGAAQAAAVSGEVEEGGGTAEGFPDGLAC